MRFCDIDKRHQKRLGHTGAEKRQAGFIKSGL